MKKNLILFAISLLSLPFTANTYESPTQKLIKSEERVTKIPYHLGSVDDEPEYYSDVNVYYSDSYFRDSSTIYNPHLASISMAMAEASAPYGDPNPGETSWYLDQNTHIDNFFYSINFTGHYYNEDYYKKTRFDSIGIACAYRSLELSTGNYTLIAIVPRSGNYAIEWSNNVYLGNGSKSDMMHEGWYNAANKLIDFVAWYINHLEINGNVKLWMSGFSRGGAVTNIAAALIDKMIEEDTYKDKLGNINITHDDVFAYTFEAPQGANQHSSKIKKPHDILFNNIWNIVNPLDFVPKVAMSQYGFTRFGQDKYIVTEFYKPMAYDQLKKVFNAMYNSLYKGTPPTYNGDKIDIYGMEIGEYLKVVGTIGIYCFLEDVDWIKKDETKANYDPNIVETLLLEETTPRLGSREHYADSGIQSNVSTILEKFFDPDETGVTGSTLKEAIPYVIGFLIAGVLLSQFTLNNGFIMEAFASSALFLPEAVRMEIVALLIPLVPIIIGTYWEKPNELISFGKAVGDIFTNHSTEVTFAHLMAQDSYYIDAYNKKYGTDYDLVPLLDNADYGRVKLTGFNQVRLYKGNVKTIDLEGKLAGKSKVNKCDKGYAVGYYSYATEEKVEVFFPLGEHKITVKDISKKPLHNMFYWSYYQFFTPSNDGIFVKRIEYFTDWDWFNSDYYTRILKLEKGGK